MPRRFALLVFVLVLAAACGGGSSEEGSDLADPSRECDRAFQAAVQPGADATTPPAGETEELDTATLDALSGTLSDCGSVDDWLAGARANPDALPRQLDRLTVLRFLCDASDGESEPCQDVLTPTEADTAG